MTERLKMPMEQRAKQFLPFAAVRGLEEALEAKRQEMLFEEKIVLASEGEEEVNRTLSSLHDGSRIRVRYYTGTNYEEEECLVVKEDLKRRYLQTEDKTIPFEDIVRLECLD